MHSELRDELNDRIGSGLRLLVVDAFFRELLAPAARLDVPSRQPTSLGQVHGFAIFRGERQRQEPLVNGA